MLSVTGFSLTALSILFCPGLTSAFFLGSTSSTALMTSGPRTFLPLSSLPFESSSLEMLRSVVLLGVTGTIGTVFGVTVEPVFVFLVGCWACEFSNGTANATQTVMRIAKTFMDDLQG